MKRRTKAQIGLDNQRIREIMENISSVEDMFDWKESDTLISVEAYNSESIKQLGWIHSDVLYSFLGVYTIGLLAYYPDLYRKTDFQIRSKENKNMYSFKALINIYNDCNELNNNSSLLTFIKHYFSIGNVLPIWPGGNSDRGKSHVFDIPEIYFSKNKEWALKLLEVHKNAYLDNVFNDKLVFEKECKYENIPPFFEFSNTTDFINSIAKEEYSKDIRIHLYTKWLDRMNGIIEERNKELRTLITHKKS